MGHTREAMGSYLLEFGVRSPAARQESRPEAVRRLRGPATISISIPNALRASWAIRFEFPSGSCLGFSLRQAQELLSALRNLRAPRNLPMRAPKTTVAIIAVPCSPSACLSVGYGQAIRQPALIATPAPAPYSAPARVGRIASEFRNTQVKSKTSIPPVTVLPTPQAKSMIHGGTTRTTPPTRNVLPTGLIENVDTVMATTTSNAATAAEYTVPLGNLPAGVLSCAAIQTSTIANVNCAAEVPQVRSGPKTLASPRIPSASRIREETSSATGAVLRARLSGRGEGLTGLRSCAIARISASGGFGERSIMLEPFADDATQRASPSFRDWRAPEPPRQ